MSTGKFFEFIQKIDKLDATPSIKDAEAKNDYDLSELDISFDKLSRPQDLTTSYSRGSANAALSKDEGASTQTVEEKESHLTEE